MNYLLATLHTLGLSVGDRIETKIKGDPERGSVTIEQVLWAVAVIAFVGIVAAVIQSFVQTEAGKIK